MRRPGSSESASLLAGLRDLTPRLLDRWVVAALVLECVAAVIDISASAPRLTTLYLVPVLALAVIDNGERTAALGLVAGLLALASGAWGHYFLVPGHLYRMAIVIGGSALSTLGAAFRCRAVLARDQMAMLARIGEIADGTTDLGTALERLAEVLVPGAADVCVLAPAGTSGIDRMISRVRAGDDATAQVIAQLPGLPPEASEVMGAGEARLITRLALGPRRRDAMISDELCAIMERTRITAAVFAPIRAGEETLALLALGVGPSGRSFGDQDLRFARTVGSRAALAIKNARLVAELQESRQRLEAIVGSLADGVTIRDPSGRLIYANDAALHFMGMSAQNEIVESDPEALFNQFEVTDEHGRPLQMTDLPSVRLLEGEEPEPLVLRFLHRGHGEEQWRVLKVSPLYDAHGRLEAAVTIIEDITQSKRLELRNAFLSRTGEILASSLDYEQTLRNVAWLAVPEVADWCAVDLVDEHGVRQQVVAAHRDPRKIELAERLRGYEPAELDPDRGLGLVLRTGRSLHFEAIPPEMIEAAAVDREHLELLRELQMHSAIVVPLPGARRTLGAMTLVNAESGRTFTADDVSFAEQIAARAAVAVENAHIYSERARIAATLQHSLLPDALPAIDGWELASLYRPASPDGTVEVGGDFYDAFATGSGWTILIGDVTGKGVEAAAMTSLVRHGARFVAEFAPDPARILARLDRSLRQQPALSLCTALCLQIVGDRLTFASAGHPLPLLVGPDGVRVVGTAGSVLGAFKDGQWPVHEVVLGPQEVLLLYTDGVTDTVGAEDRFGEQRLLRTLVECGPGAPEELVRCLDAALTAFQVGAQADDTAVLALRLAGDPQPAVLPAAERRS